VVYLEQLRGLSRGNLEQATVRTIREWDKPNMMPPIKFILDRAVENLQVQAEAAWMSVERLVFKVWHPDVGWPGGMKPDIDPATEYAIRQCGGMRRIHDVELDATQFVRRDFLEAFKRFTAEGGAQVALSEKQAAGILGGIQKALSERTQLALPSKQDRAAGFTQIAEAPKPKPRETRQQTPEEYEAQIAKLKQQTEQLRVRQEKTA
jgi:hypothetical protein